MSASPFVAVQPKLPPERRAFVPVDYGNYRPAGDDEDWRDALRHVDRMTRVELEILLTALPARHPLRPTAEKCLR